METLNKINCWLFNQEDISLKLDNEIKQIIDIPEDECSSEQDNDYNSEFDTLTDSDSDSESDGRILKGL